MDKTAIKNFAISARRKLIEGVRQKAYGLGISDKEIKEIEEVPDGSRLEINNNYVYLNNKDVENRKKLREQIESKGYEQVIEEVAYTWFNRIIAIRFMEANDYLPSGVRVLSSEESGKIEPDAVTNAHDLVEELELNKEKVYNFQDNNDSEGLFKYILIKQCNALGKIMPVMFEKIEDYTELLLPDNLLVEGSVVRDLVSNISEEDFREQVEIIGWLYQYYISERKEEVINVLKGNKKINKEEIPFATQLFTPDWIVKYMVQNTLGKLWIDNNLHSKLKDNWEFYIDNNDENKEKNILRIKSPEDIRFIDPSVGSGHILVYAFDILYEIYLDCGYSEREIPRLIIENNLYGIDIDDRAGQLAYFALIMKARSYSKRIFRDIEKNHININVCSIQESNTITVDDIKYFSNGNKDLEEDVTYLIQQFLDAKEYGSMIELKDVNLDKIETRLKEIEKYDDSLINMKNRINIMANLPNILNQSRIMLLKYDICVTNPPYMNNKGMDDRLKLFINKRFIDVKSDLFSVFIKRNFYYTKTNGYLGYMTPLVWMFIKSYENLREYIIKNKTILSLIQLQHDSAYEDVSVGVCTFTFKNCKSEYRGEYIRLSDFYGIKLQPEKVLEAIKNKEVYYRYSYSQKNFEMIPTRPIAYWADENILKIFKNKKLGEDCVVKEGLKTGDNDRFIRKWYEVDLNKTNIINKDNPKWIKLTKGGQFRKWFGNNEEVINYENDGKELKEFKKSSLTGRDNYLKENITWTRITTGKISFRYTDEGSIPNMAGLALYTKDIYYILGYLNTKLSKFLLELMNPTLNFPPGTMASIPVVDIKDENKKDIITKLVKEAIYLSKLDYNSKELSYNFNYNNIIKKANSLNNIYILLESENNELINKISNIEMNINNIFLDHCNLLNMKNNNVEEINTGIERINREKFVKAFISYAVGCMMGRYSIDEEGLVFAGGDFDINKYKTFGADKDAIIPITDEEYFEDDIVSKFVEFVKIIFGEDSLEENLNYISDTPVFKRKANETSRDVLRRYFLKGFMEDHLKVYQKRPIYWMFDSGKQNGFKALIYMHRYDENMVAKIRTDYLHTLQRKYESEINRLDNDINSEMLSTKEKANAKKLKEKIQKQLVECTSYDQVIAHVAHQRISIDLDDGVKVNYQKFQGVEVPQGDGKKDLKADLLFKVKI